MHSCIRTCWGCRQSNCQREEGEMCREGVVLQKNGRNVSPGANFTAQWPHSQGLKPIWMESKLRKCACFSHPTHILQNRHADNNDIFSVFPLFFPETQQYQWIGEATIWIVSFWKRKVKNDLNISDLWVKEVTLTRQRLIRCVFRILGEWMMGLLRSDRRRHQWSSTPRTFQSRTKGTGPSGSGRR